MKHLFGAAIIAAALAASPAIAETLPGGGGHPGGGQHGGMGGGGMRGGQQFHRGGGFASGGGQHFGNGDNYRRGYGDRGNGWAAGAAGLAAGAIVGGAIAADGGYYDGAQPGPYYNNDNPGYAYGAPPAPGYADESSDGSVSYCQQTYRSYNPSTGTYLGFDGQQHSCP